MDESAMLKCIFRDKIEEETEEGRRIYRITHGKECIELECDEEYPETVPRISLTRDMELAKAIRREARKFLSTPMVYDIVRLYAEASEGVEMGGDGRALTITYATDQTDKMTEDEFLEWKRENRRTRAPQDRVTGKQHFLKRRRSMKNDHSDEEEPNNK
jgi:hypothetical protein